MEIKGRSFFNWENYMEWYGGWYFGYLKEWLINFKLGYRVFNEVDEKELKLEREVVVDVGNGGFWIF